MKTRILLLLPLVLSCEIMQEDIDLTQEPKALPVATTSLQAVWERVQQSEFGFVEFSREEDSLWVAAFVTSSDEGGNFYKELFVQDLGRVFKGIPQEGNDLRMFVDVIVLLQQKWRLGLFSEDE